MTTQVVVVGGSGFGRETLGVLEAIRRSGADIEVLGVVDDDPSHLTVQALTRRGVALVRGLPKLLAMNSDRVRYVLAIGAQAIRRRLVHVIERHGFLAFTAMHPSANFGEMTTVGRRAMVCAGAVVSSSVQVGDHAHLNPNCTIGHDAVLESFVSVNPAATVAGMVRMGAGTLLGAASTVLQKLYIGSDATVGAMACVTGDVPGGAVVNGVPGRWNA